MLPIAYKLVILYWTRFFFISLSILSSIFFSSSLLAGFLRRTVTAQEAFWGTVLSYPIYLSKILMATNIMASIFTLLKLRNQNELMALYSLGVSKKTLSGILIFMSVGVGLLEFLNLSFLGPSLQKKKEVLIKNNSSRFTGLEKRGVLTDKDQFGKTWLRSQDYFFTFSFYEKRQVTLYDVSLYFFKNYEMTEMLFAKQIVYLPKEQQWMALEGTLFEIKENISFPVKTDFKKKSVALLETPQDFKEIEVDSRTLNLFQLRKYIKRLEKASLNAQEFLVEYHHILSSAFFCLLLGVIPLGLLDYTNRREGRSPSLLIGSSLALLFFYWVLQAYVIELTKSEKIPLLQGLYGLPVGFMLFLGGINFIRFMISSVNRRI